jgi:hypothetical protein
MPGGAGVTEYQVRVYEVKPGEMAEWLDEWRREIVPLRAKHGFNVVGAWADGEQNTFVSVMSYDGEGGYAAANAAYYESPERAALDPDPARHLLRVEAWMARPVLP